MTLEELVEKYQLKPRGGYPSIGPGWVDLVDSCLADLSRLGIQMKDVVQIKEKLGGLRLYIDHGSDAVFDRIAVAEGQAAKTCEQCGLPGKLFAHDGWLYTACAIHWKPRSKEITWKEEK
jgi:hypothetical protein